MQSEQPSSTPSHSEESEPQQAMESSPIGTQKPRRPRAVAAASATDSTRPNRCPPAGTPEAKARTLKASYARCKDDAARAKFLAKHNLTAEDMQPIGVSSKTNDPSMEPSDESVSRRVSRRSEPHESIPKRARTQAYSTVPDVDHEPEVLRRRMALDRLIREPVHQRTLREAEAYYYGRGGRPHTFCLIVRLRHTENTTEEVYPSDYICLGGMQHPAMTGLQALHTVHALLNLIQNNAASLRCEIQAAANSWEKNEPAGCPLLLSLMRPSLRTSPLKGAVVFDRGSSCPNISCQSGSLSDEK